MQYFDKQQVETDIQKSIEVVRTAARFSEYSKVFPETNENLIKKYSDLEEGRYQKALTVLSSGDHTFNLLLNGITNIDAFDSNRMTEYYVMGIKIPALLNMNYEQYRKFQEKLIVYGVPKEEIIAVLKSANEKYQYFWQEFYRRYKDMNDEEFEMKNLFLSKEDRWHYNRHLVCENGYKKLQSCLKDATITFSHSNITSLPLDLGAYDLIELSNILNYYEEIFKACENPREERKKLVSEIVSQNLSEQGTIFYDYFLGTARYNLINATRTVEVENTNGFIVDCSQGVALGLTKNKNSNL